MTARRAPEWLKRWEYAHRGLHGEGVPENSLAAAQGAIAAGMGIECDIQMSRDNVPLVFHDWELERLTKERGKVAARPADELCRIPLAETGQTIWQLTDLLGLAAGRVPILVEIKAQPHLSLAQACIAIAKVLADYNGPFAVMSIPNALTGMWRETGRPLLTWTVRSPATRERGLAHADALIAEGAGLA